MLLRLTALRSARPSLSRASFRALSTTQADRPLAGIKVVDLTRVLAGPTATMFLIESPTGDDTRSWAPPTAPKNENGPRPDLPAESAYFLQANRNKRSIVMNLRAKEAQDAMHKMIKDADVFVENYVPGKLAKFGLDWETLHKINPRLIYCSVTGYGSTGPYAKNPGYDVVIEAEAGLMHITGERGGTPVKIASLANIGSNYLIGGQEASRWGTAHPSIVPYQVFPTGDGWIMVAAGNDGQFKLLCNNVLDKPEWVTDERFAVNAARVKNRDTLVPLISEVLKQKSTQDWVEKLTGKGLPFAPINNIGQTFNHPQAKARGVVEEVEAYRPPPYLGEHTEEVLKEAGYTPEQIEDLRKNGAIA
ncbi:acyl CoA transferase [Trichosporon asahii var. asahii CBS 2479]|uniref:Acyl CoA transferase n=1 Tax=Trichosporon asahii var. asahii (strain ATCC 90039 / CBS 2479 / JCM 2466 / KCTC 7840 / NBRC 103889/ NCYC 2677 / UAMH 7654) TaxID=1186058 RepID=J6F5G4_TRIAS|nr:acyl CoA transferase [Trichosporon asahii var. asahii CBS 2479]EJT50512.1 acyl CoA transferase [Trichosporon asahii var. asahii CBS 2479]